MSTYFEEHLLDGEWGRSDWNGKMEAAGFLVPDFLWDALVDARNRCAPETPFQEIANDQLLMATFNKIVRSFVGDSVTDEMILNATVAMPQQCEFCSIEDWCHCVDCGGCTMCCCSEYHCATCSLPLGFCRQCPQKFVDSAGTLMPD